MIIIEKPYASEFFINTILTHDIRVLSNEAVLQSGIEEGAFNLWDSDKAKNYYTQQEYPLIYSNSENAVDWVLNNLPESNLSSYIRLFKDKTAFRQLLKKIYPNFYFESVKFSDLKNFNTSNIKFPVVIKPAVGFLSFGVHPVANESDWKQAVDLTEKEMQKAKSLYPNSVVDSSMFLIEQKIEGTEYAIDAYYDRNGEPVILNIFRHPFLNEKDVRDRIYIMSAEIMISHMAKFHILLREIGELENIRNFPFHIELRVTDSGEIIPIEINPMRFAGWCTTDVAKYAWGINVYEYFFKQKSPDWTTLLSKADSTMYYFSMAEVPPNIPVQELKSFKYNRFLANYSNILELRRINPRENPLFAIIFGSTKEQDEIQRILSLNTANYLI